MAFKKTTADVPPQVANEYAKAPRGQAVSEATGDGYTKTKAMQKGAMPGKGKSQFGLPKSPGLHLRISVRPDTDKDKM
jgi:hypothetical protein